VPHNDLDGLSAEDFQRIYAVNTIGPFQMIRAARPLLETAAKASGHASSVVNVSSVAGIGGGGSSVAYAASRGALNTITQSLARALAPLIRVNTVCPGYIDTPWFTKGQGADGAKQVRDMIIAKVPLKTASTAEEIAQLVCFLALPQSGQMTGERPHGRRIAFGPVTDGVAPLIRHGRAKPSEGRRRFRSPMTRPTTTCTRC
jgi:NAD(P)-dependent dehydrogenase (short-subunit alcohol dehydrogenase family)